MSRPRMPAMLKVNWYLRSLSVLSRPRMPDMLMVNWYLRSLNIVSRPKMPNMLMVNWYLRSFNVLRRLKRNQQRRQQARRRRYEGGVAEAPLVPFPLSPPSPFHCDSAPLRQPKGGHSIGRANKRAGRRRNGPLHPPSTPCPCRRGMGTKPGRAMSGPPIKSVLSFAPAHSGPVKR